MQPRLFCGLTSFLCPTAPFVRESSTFVRAHLRWHFAFVPQILLSWLFHPQIGFTVHNPTATNHNYCTTWACPQKDNFFSLATNRHIWAHHHIGTFSFDWMPEILKNLQKHEVLSTLLLPCSTCRKSHFDKFSCDNSNIFSKRSYNDNGRRRNMWSV